MAIELNFVQQSCFVNLRQNEKVRHVAVATLSTQIEDGLGGMLSVYKGNTALQGFFI